MFYDNGVIVANWPRSKAVKNNWGDKLNSELIQKLSGLPVAHLNNVSGWQDRPVYRVIGSGLASMSPNDIIWGMGFIDATSMPASSAAQICAVRGPLSRKRLLEMGVNCPEIYGDPAVLYPLIYWPGSEKIYDYGIILHCREAGVIDPIQPIPGASVLHIDICGDLEDVVQKILSCKTIISSSLHGIICAHSYGIPAYWLKASDLPLGDGFKFYDYFHSIGWEDVEATTLSPTRQIELKSLTEPEKSLIDGAQLIDACPFLPLVRKQLWKGKLAQYKNNGMKGTIFR